MHTAGSETPLDDASSELSQHRIRLGLLRQVLAQRGLDAFIVRSTDRYLNEYVPEDESTRQWLTGFTGSMGDALVTLTEALLFVDGRYHLQAEQEVDSRSFEVVKLTLAEPIFSGLCGRLKTLVTEGKLRAVGYEMDRTTVQERETLERLLDGTGVQATPLLPSPLEVLKGSAVTSPGDLRILNENMVGCTSAQKVAFVRDAVQKAGVDLLLVERLDDLAYLTNLRANELPYQATFKGMAAVGLHGAVVALHSRPVVNDLCAARQSFHFVDEAGFPNALAAVAGNGRKAGYDGAGTTEASRQLLMRVGFTPVSIQSPLTEMKARKTPQELEVMVDAFARADVVVSRAVAWLCTLVEKGERVTEADFARRVESSFAKSGAVGLSFKVISAAGANGAIIHYSTPDARRVIRKGELMLLDTGAYYEAGYATDLTRTFLVGGARTKATKQHKRLYTAVLRSAIAGMTARVPLGAPGIALDAITRKPLWDEGLNYNHGTGHGVGINVHEAPPSISMRSMQPLQAGYVFSIEPGVYLPGWGGIRIENLCTLEAVAGSPEWGRVRPLTFSPLDLRLVDRRALNREERAFLKDFMMQGKRVLKRARKMGAAEQRVD
jgi:Xaa-Pro aminopeptidase